MTSQQKSSVRSILYFDSMLTPKIVTFVYWLALLGIVLTATMMMAQENIVGGILTLLLGVFFARIWCELMIVIFKINENIQKIADR